MELVSLEGLSRQVKGRLLGELGYRVDGKHVVDAKGSRVKDRYTGELVNIDHLVIVPGSTLILDDNPLSLASYLEEFGDPF